MPLPAYCIFAITGCIAAALFLTQPAQAQSATPSSSPTNSQSVVEPAAMLAVVDVNLSRYGGVWYEQARLPNRFQRKCTGQVAARYALRADGHIEVLNRCVESDGSVASALGEARKVPLAGRADAGRLEVRFAPAWLGWLPFVWGDYWVLQIDADYQVSVVGTPDRKYLWVLSRQPRLDDARLGAALDYAKSVGFATNEVVRTPATPALPMHP